MSKYVEFTLPDNSTVIMETDDTAEGIRKVSGDDKSTVRAQDIFEKNIESIRKSALLVLEKIRTGMAENAPDEVEINFGIKASGELGNLVIGKAGAKANYSVRLTWKASAPAGA